MLCNDYHLSFRGNLKKGGLVVFLGNFTWSLGNFGWKNSRGGKGGLFPAMGGKESLQWSLRKLTVTCRPKFNTLGKKKEQRLWRFPASVHSREEADRCFEACGSQRSMESSLLRLEGSLQTLATWWSTPWGRRRGNQHDVYTKQSSPRR